VCARLAAFVAWLVLALSPVTAAAQAPAAPPDWSVSLAGRVWVASGWSNWNFRSAGVDPLTDLRWRGVDGVVGEVAADVTWKRLVWMVTAGGTRLDDGVLLAEDFAASGRQERFSLTRSPLDDGHVLYVEHDVGARLLRWGEDGWLDAFVGYQYWREEYTAAGLQGSLFVAPGLTVDQAEPASVKAATHEYRRHSLRLGARARVPLGGGFSLHARAAVSPWTRTEHDATPFLRPDVQAPVRSRASGGFGTQLEAGLAWAAWRGLSLEAGFRYWYFDSGSGEVTTTSITGQVSRDRLNEAVTERYGPYLGARWRF
jgi:hypothetical protein